MKKAFLFLTLALVYSCSKDETIREVEVIREVSTIIDNTAPNILVKTENWLKTHENGYGSNKAAEILNTEIKKVLDQGDDYHFFNIYVGDHRHDREDIPGSAGYGNKNTVIIVFFKNNQNQEIRVYKPTGDNNLRYADYLSIKQTNYAFSNDFFKNEFIGSISTSDYLSL